VSELAATSGEVVPFAEDARTLDALFRLCYPVANPVLATARDVFNVMEASKKYMVEHATKFCLGALMAPPILEKEPFSVFNIACYYELADEARAAAKAGLRHTSNHSPFRNSDRAQARASCLTSTRSRLSDWHTVCRSTAADICARAHVMDGSTSRLLPLYHVPWH